MGSIEEGAFQAARESLFRATRLQVSVGGDCDREPMATGKGAQTNLSEKLDDVTIANFLIRRDNCDPFGVEFVERCFACLGTCCHIEARALRDLRLQLLVALRHTGRDTRCRGHAQFAMRVGGLSYGPVGCLMIEQHRYL